MASGNEQLRVSRQPCVTRWGLAQVLRSLTARLLLGSIVAGGSMLCLFLCLFSLPKIFVQQQKLISKPLPVTAVCSQLELKTSAPRVGSHRLSSCLQLRS